MEYRLIIAVALSLLVAFTDAQPGKATLRSDKTTVDLGGTFVLTCEKAEKDKRNYNLYIGFKTGTPLIKVVSNDNNVSKGNTLTVTATTATSAPYACYVIDYGSTDGNDSDTKTIAVKAIVAPKLTVYPSIRGIVPGIEVTFTCREDAVNSKPKQYRFFKGWEDITGIDKTASKLKVKMAKDDHGKEIFCQFYNADWAKEDSNKLKAIYLAPIDPESITFSDITTTSATATWKASMYVDSYIVSISPTTGGAKVVPRIVRTTTTTLMNLTPGRSYLVTIRVGFNSFMSNPSSRSVQTPAKDILITVGFALAVMSIIVNIVLVVLIVIIFRVISREGSRKGESGNATPMTQSNNGFERG